MKTQFLICLLVLSTCLSLGDARKRQRTTTSTTEVSFESEQDDYILNPESFPLAEECFEANGFFPDPEQCDKYYECKNGQPTSKLCSDGLVFVNAGSNLELCTLPHSVDCEGREKLQDPIPSENCPRKNGYFADPDPKVCNRFFRCVEGQANEHGCSDGLVFSHHTGRCDWPDVANREHCNSATLFEFQCPNVISDRVHPIFADPKDCQHFYVCIEGTTPRRQGCMDGQVFNPETSRCDKPKNVPKCKDWYAGKIEYDEDGEEITTTMRPRTRKFGRRRTTTTTESSQFESEAELEFN